MTSMGKPYQSPRGEGCRVSARGRVFRALLAGVLRTASACQGIGRAMLVHSELVAGLKEAAQPRLPELPGQGSLKPGDGADLDEAIDVVEPLRRLQPCRHRENPE